MEEIVIVSPQEISRVEKLAIAEGCDEAIFMEKAGTFIASWIQEAFSCKKTPIYLLVGKGNNGGDALVAGRLLLEKGYLVHAFCFYAMEDSSPLCQHQRESFRGELIEVNEIESLQCPTEGILVDGLVGTGFHGTAQGKLAQAIAFANKTNLPIIAIDIPSGLCGMSGRVESIAIRAKATIYLEFPKIGFFLQDGWGFVGKIVRGHFGLPSSYQKQVQAEAFLVEGESLASHLQLPSRTQNKYQRGYVLVVAGSAAMMGAGALASYAALRAGAGIVRWFYPEGPISSDIHVEPEVIQIPMTDTLEEIFLELPRAGALLLGPGMGRDELAFLRMKMILSSVNLPLVIDADALFFLSENPSFSLPDGAILTPHLGELKRLLHAHKIEGDFFSSCQELSLKTKGLLLVKGAPSFLFSPGEKPIVLPFGNPGMATAGSGDVLGGIIAACLSKGYKSKEAICLGCYLHGLSGDLAAEEKTVFSLTASDLIAYLPKAFSLCLEGRD